MYIYTHICTFLMDIGKNLKSEIVTYYTQRIFLGTDIITLFFDLLFRDCSPGSLGTKSENLCITYFLKHKIFWHHKYCVLWAFMVGLHWGILYTTECLWEGQQIFYFSILDIRCSVEKIVLYSSLCNCLILFLSCP